MFDNIQKQSWKRLGVEDLPCQILKHALKLLRSSGQCWCEENRDVGRKATVQKQSPEFRRLLENKCGICVHRRKESTVRMARR